MKRIVVVLLAVVAAGVGAQEWVPIPVPNGDFESPGGGPRALLVYRVDAWDRTGDSGLLQWGQGTFVGFTMPSDSTGETALSQVLETVVEPGEYRVRVRTGNIYPGLRARLEMGYSTDAESTVLAAVECVPVPLPRYTSEESDWTWLTAVARVDEESAAVGKRLYVRVCGLVPGDQEGTIQDQFYLFDDVSLDYRALP